MMHEPHDGEPTAVIPIQPRPINTRVAYISGDGGLIETAIARTWMLSDARRCRLCSECQGSVSSDGLTALCLLVAKGHVPIGEAPLFRPRRLVPDGVTEDGRMLAEAPGSVQALGDVARRSGGTLGTG